MTESLQKWIRDQVHYAAEQIGYDLQTIPESEQAAILFDFSTDAMYSSTEPEAQLYRDHDPTIRQGWVWEAVNEFSL